MLSQPLGHRRPAQPVEQGFLTAGEELRQQLIDDDRGEIDVRLDIEPFDELDRLGHRHLFGRGDDDGSGRRRILQHLQDPLDLAAHDADVDHFSDGFWRRELTNDVTRRRRIDDDEIEVVLTDFERKLADGENLAHPWSGVRDEVEHACQCDRCGRPRGCATRGGTP